MPDVVFTAPEVIAELIDTVEATRPGSLVYCNDHPVAALEGLADQGCRVCRVECIGQLDALERCDLGVVFDFLEHRPASAGQQILCRLRNLKCERLWVAVSTSPAWQFSTLIGLGFRRNHCYRAGDREICTYSYDLATYNRKREWNNPRFWANPENWGKYRW